MKTNRNKKDKRIKHSLFGFNRFIYIFLFSAFLVTCTFMTFFRRSRIPDFDIIIANETLSSRALTTLLNIIFLCTVFSFFGALIRKLTVGVPVNRILDATRKISKGEFDVRIKPLNPISTRNELDVIAEDLNKMAQELATIEMLKTDFIANISHEMKTPLSVIQNYCVLLESDDLSEQERIRYAHSLYETSKRMEGLITNILKLNKLENQQIFPNTKTYNLSEQLCSCLLLFEDELDKRAINIKNNIQQDIFICCDNELLEIVWSNILSNAIKFNKDNGSITVTLTKSKTHAIISIEDTGYGMSDDVGKRIFEKFYQGDPSRSTRGNGLGLTLVKRVMDIVGGEIKVKSICGLGTTVTVTLPLNNEN